MKWKVRTGFVFTKGIKPIREGEVFEANIDEIKSQDWKVERFEDNFTTEDNLETKKVVEPTAPARKKIELKKEEIKTKKKICFGKIKK